MVRLQRRLLGYPRGHAGQISRLLVHSCFLLGTADANNRRIWWYYDSVRKWTHLCDLVDGRRHRLLLICYWQHDQSCRKHGCRSGRAELEARFAKGIQIANTDAHGDVLKNKTSPCAQSEVLQQLHRIRETSSRIAIVATQPGHLVHTRRYSRKDRLLQR